MYDLAAGQTAKYGKCGVQSCVVEACGVCSVADRMLSAEKRRSLMSGQIQQGSGKFHK